MKENVLTTRRRSVHGNAIVEASLTLMVFLIFVFSLFDWGVSLYLNQSVVHQARVGARYGAVHPDDLTAIKNMVLYNDTTARPGAGIMGLQASGVTVTRAGTPNTATDRIVVNVKGFNFTWITPGWAGKHTAKAITVTIPVEN